MKTRRRKEFGQYIVADPEICGGQLTFKGTRIFVKDVLAMLAKGYDWGRISASQKSNQKPLNCWPRRPKRKGFLLMPTEAASRDAQAKKRLSRAVRRSV
jgi:hypothetical protein